LELRWETGDATAPPARTVDTYLAKLRKKARKAGIEMAVQRDLGLASPKGKEVECYRWTADRQALAMLSRCSTCGRTVHVHLLGKPDEQLRNLARTIFSSLRDHSDDGSELWRFFDMEFRTPEGLALKASSLKTGCIAMTFGRRGLRLEVVRVSVADVALAGREMDAWFRDFYARNLKRRVARFTPASVKGHAGMAVSGRPWVLVNPLRFLGRPRAFRATIWHCEETNKLLVCAYDGPAREQDMLDAVSATLQCCGAGGPPPSQ
jgi:hypothetical protein